MNVPFSSTRITKKETHPLLHLPSTRDYDSNSIFMLSITKCQISRETTKQMVTRQGIWPNSWWTKKPPACMLNNQDTRFYRKEKEFQWEQRYNMAYMNEATHWHNMELFVFMPSFLTIVFAIVLCFCYIDAALTVLDEFCRSIGQIYPSHVWNQSCTSSHYYHCH